MARGFGGVFAVGILTAAAFGAYEGSQGKLPPTLQAEWNKYIGAPSGGTSGSGPAAACSTSAIATWSQGINLPAWVGTLYCADKGGLPPDIPTLTAWGDSKGYRVNGAWVQPTAGS